LSVAQVPEPFIVPGSDGRGVRHTVSRLRSYLFFVPLLYLLTAVLGVISLVLSLFDKDGRLQHAIARLWAKLILRITTDPVEVIGANGVNWNQPTVYAANHLSAFDIPVLYATLETPFRIIAKKELFRLPFLGWHLRRSGQIPVDADNARASFRSLNKAVESIRHGHPIVIFPEGGRSPSGELLPFMSGPFYIAIKAGVPITPIAIVGTYEMLPMNTYHIMPHHLKLAIGKPIPVEGYTLRDLDVLSVEVEAAIRELLQKYGN
jgi:1-acyl-sn-glycerol-3-phosphate acyltransferase